MSITPYDSKNKGAALVRRISEQARVLPPAARGALTVAVGGALWLARRGGRQLAAALLNRAADEAANRVLAPRQGDAAAPPVEKPARQRAVWVHLTRTTTRQEADGTITRDHRSASFQVVDDGDTPLNIDLDGLP
ncbi:MAG: hypothetical protein ACOCXZ_02270 [Chloroflexota bacterium]